MSSHKRDKPPGSEYPPSDETPLEHSDGDQSGGKSPEGTFYDAKFSIEAMQHEPYRDGFTWRSVVGAFFIAFVMLPGTIFMGLMIGEDLGNAADWVTIILFVELARRSFMVLRKQELYVLNYTVKQLSHIKGGLALGGGVFAFLVWQRYLRNSEAFHNFGIAHAVPDWFAPYGDAAYLPFTNSVWWPAVGVIVSSMFLNKLMMLSLGYVAFKLTADVEKLPFPLAPIHAEGAIALAESSSETHKRGFRQYCFSIGVIVGAVFGFFYVAIPTLSSAFLGETIRLIPIPFWDLTTTFEDVMPGATIGISLNMGLLFTGFVLPWRIVLGMFTTTVAFQWLVNPFILQPYGLLPHWQPGKDAIETHVATTIDVYLSVGIGTAFAVFFIGFYGMMKSWVKYTKSGEAKGQTAGGDFDMRRFWQRDRERGDPPTWVALVVWAACSAAFVALCYYLINSSLRPGEEPFSLWWLIAFAFLWTPLNTYINARMSGIAGQYAGVPFIFESAVFISRFSNVSIWFAPLPLHNYGNMADRLKETELTRTRFTSLLKVELLIFPLLLIASFIFWSYILTLGPIPSDHYPYVQKFWPQFSQMRALWAASMQEGQPLLLEALKPWVIGTALLGTMGLLVSFPVLGISTQYIYGGLGAMNGYPHMAVPIFVGALLGRFFFSKKFGRERWTNFAPILTVGFGAGLGLIGMLAIAIHFLYVSVGIGY